MPSMLFEIGFPSVLNENEKEICAICIIIQEKTVYLNFKICHNMLFFLWKYSDLASAHLPMGSTHLKHELRSCELTSWAHELKIFYF